MSVSIVWWIPSRCIVILLLGCRRRTERMHAGASIALHEHPHAHARTYTAASTHSHDTHAPSRIHGRPLTRPPPTRMHARTHLSDSPYRITHTILKVRIRYIELKHVDYLCSEHSSCNDGSRMRSLVSRWIGASTSSIEI